MCFIGWEGFWVLWVMDIFDDLECWVVGCMDVDSVFGQFLFLKGQVFVVWFYCVFVEWYDVGGMKCVSFEV